MLAECLEKCAQAEDVHQISTHLGVIVYGFTVDEGAGDTLFELPLQSENNRIEVVFCSFGVVTWQDFYNNTLTLEKGQVLLLSEMAAYHNVHLSGGLNGFLVSIDMQELEKNICCYSALLGRIKLNVEQGMQRLKNRHGCIVLENKNWCQSFFEELCSLPPKEHERYVFFKAMELLYLLCSSDQLPGERGKSNLWGNYLDHTVMEIQHYMNLHLGEKLTIAGLSQQFYISPTAFKERFRQLYGQPVHSWLQDQRMKQAAALLQNTSMNVLQVAQTIGYEGTSQFTVAFKNRYGMTPKQYAKMSKTGEF